jgi:hypothetical protein
MKRFLIIILFLAATISNGWADHGNIQQTLDHLKSALNDHDFEQLTPLLATNFSFNSYDGEMGRMIMRQIVDQYPKAIASISIKNVEKSGQQFNVTTEFHFQGESEEKMLTLSADYKIIQAPIVQIQKVGHGTTQNETSSTTEKIPARMVVPFELAGRLIVVEAEIEGVRGNFLVDSGSPTFVLNAGRLVQLSDLAKPLDQSIHGASGAVQNVMQVDALGFIWKDIELASINAIFYDLSHLEKNVGVDVLGIIGVEFLQRFTLVFDYDQQELTLITEDPAKFWSKQPTNSIEFTMIGHIPVIDAKIGEQPLLFGIDCGAAAAMLFTKWEEPLQNHYQFLGQSVLTGADHNSQVGNEVKLAAFVVDGLSYKDHTFRFNDLVFNHEIVIDGLIGYEFLSEYKTAIDYTNRKLYVWER